MPVNGIEPGRTYVLSFLIFREAFQNGRYPEVELFGERIYLNQHTSSGRWQPVELLVTAPQDSEGETSFRFLTQAPCTFWLTRPSLRPYLLSDLTVERTPNGVLVQWGETRNGLVIEMVLSVENARGEQTVRKRFLNVEAQAASSAEVGEESADDRLAAVSSSETQVSSKGDVRADREGGLQADPGRSEVAVSGGMAWLRLEEEGTGPYRVRVKSRFAGEEIASAVSGWIKRDWPEGTEDVPGIPSQVEPARTLPRDFFPIGIFNVPPEGIARTCAAGFNTVLVNPPPRGDPGGLSPASDNGPQRWILSTLEGRNQIETEDPRMEAIRSDYQKVGGERVLCTYIADEPELTGTSPADLYFYSRQIDKIFPGAPTSAALVRSRFLPYYRHCVDWFLIDPYPIPTQPLTWMADSLDAATASLGEGRAMAVVQAFGGQDVASEGWRRFPTEEEMRALAFLAVVHGARGILFYDYPNASSSTGKWEAVEGVVASLRGLSRWFLLPREDPCAGTRILGPEGWERDVHGRVHVALFREEGKGAWALAVVNPGPHALRFRIPGLPGGDRVIKEALSGEPITMQAGEIEDRAPPLGVKVYLYEAGEAG